MTDETELAARTKTFNKAHEDLRRKIAEDTARFLAGGGSVTQVPAGTYQHDAKLQKYFRGTGHDAGE